MLNNFRRIFLAVRYRAVGIVTRVTRAPRLTHYHKKPSYTRNMPKEYLYLGMYVYDACFSVRMHTQALYIILCFPFVCYQT
jgi:hypothetical protein